MPEHPHGRVRGREGEGATVKQPDARNGVPEDAPSAF